MEDIMTTIKTFIKKHSVPTYFALTFAISWGGLLLVSGGPGGFPDTKEQFERQLPLFIPLLLAGPSVAGILLTILADGRAGFRELLSRLCRWRVGIRWYAVAFLTAPLVLTGILLALSQASLEFLPGIVARSDKASLLLMGIVAGLVVGLFEELGWTGFATPRLRLRYGIVATGLIVGVLWGGWHVFLNAIWVGKAYSGGLSPALFLAARGFGDLVGLLPAFRVLTVWVYDRTGSLLVAMLMHASLTASTMIVEPLGISGVTLLIYDLVSAAAMWIVVASFAVGQQKRSLAATA
jgi:membrane protease YdiL (CAAX protease family)